MRRVAVVLAILIVGFVNAAARGQEDEPDPAPADRVVDDLARAIESVREPATQIERLQARTGVVVVTRYEPIGKTPGRYEYDVAVTACRVSDLRGGAAVRGLAIDAIDDRGDFVARAFIDEAEIQGLLDAIDALSQVKAQGSGYDDFVASYRTTGGLAVTTYSTPSGQGGVAAVIGFGGVGRLRGTEADLSVDQLTRLRQLIVQARDAFDTIP